MFKTDAIGPIMLRSMELLSALRADRLRTPEVGCV